MNHYVLYPFVQLITKQQFLSTFINFLSIHEGFLNNV